MALKLDDKLVVGISSRALFDLEDENQIFENDGLDAYSQYQLDHENDILKPGTAFPLIKALHRLNCDGHYLTEIIIMSKNSANTSLRVFNSIEHYGLDISRAALVGGSNIAPYLSAFGDNLILAEFYEISKGHIGELRSWMDTKWTVELEKIRESPIYEKIVKLNFPIIYTTNYDHCIETAFEAWNKNYKKIVSVDDFVNIDSLTTQIVKFHGDTISDDSIVLTESSYFERLAFESPLDVKLRADMLGKSILFIGYSLSDINIRLLIYKLDQLWKRSNNYCKRPKSYVFLPAPNPIQETILNNRGIQAIVGEKLDKTESIDTFLKTLL